MLFVSQGLSAVATDIGSSYCVLGLMGPNAREVLSRAAPHDDVSTEALPFGMSKEIGVGYALCRASRVTYVGELGWELYIPTEFALSVYDELFKHGEAFGLKDGGAGNIFFPCAVFSLWKKRPLTRQARDNMNVRTSLFLHRLLRDRVDARREGLPRVWCVRKTAFSGAICTQRRPFHQDRLGSKIRKQMRFLQATSCRPWSRRARRAWVLQWRGTSRGVLLASKPRLMRRRGAICNAASTSNWTTLRRCSMEVRDV